MVSVRFEPWGARLLLEMPVDETTDRWIGLDDLPRHGLDGVGDRIREARTDRDRIASIEQALLVRLERNRIGPFI